MQPTTAETIRSARKRKGLTIPALAAKVGVAPRTVIRWEGGDSLPWAQHLIALAHVLGIAPRLLAIPSDDDDPGPAAPAMVAPGKAA